MAKGQNRYKTCVALAGSQNAGVILYRLGYWMPRTKLLRKGKGWVAMDRAAWMDETQLSRDQYNRGLARLVQMGLVESCQMHFARRNITHLRLTARALEAMPWAFPELSGEKPRSSTGATLLDHKGLTSKPSLQSPSEPVSNAIHACAHEEDSGGDDMTIKKGLTVSQIISSSPENLPPPPTPAPAKKLSPSGLGHLWNTLYAAAHPDEFQIPWTMKQLGQFKHFAKACPPGTAADVLETVLTNWSYFTAVASTEAGAYNPPSKPKLSFVMANLQTAVNLKQKLAAPAPEVGPATPTPVQLIAPAKKITKPSDAATPEEIAAILGPEFSPKKAKSKDGATGA